VACFCAVFDHILEPYRYKNAVLLDTGTMLMLLLLLLAFFFWSSHCIPQKEKKHEKNHHKKMPSTFYTI